MGKLHYAVIASLDGYVADADGNFDWAEPDEELHAYFNEFERQFGTALYGRKLYETMRVWQNYPDESNTNEVEHEYARVWRAQKKVVFSSTLDEVTSQQTTLEREFEIHAVQELVRAAPTDVSIGGPTIAATALRAGIVDYVHLFVVPHLVGGGTPAFPDGMGMSLELVESHEFSGGTVRMLYRVT